MWKIREYFASESGNFSIMFAIGMTTLLVGVGAAVDVNRLHSDRQKAQDFADSISLSAAIFVTQNDRMPRNSHEGFVDGKTYHHGEKDRNKNGDVSFQVNYDMDVNEEIVVEVTGTTSTIFMHVLGHENVTYKATSTAKFKSNTITPNSVALILDNSGSMWFDDRPGTCSTGELFCETSAYSRPENPIKRIDGLKLAANSFLAQMNDMNLRYEESNPEGTRAVRTAMMAYNEDNISIREVPFNWGILSSGEINAMTPGGGTNSFPSMGKVYDWITGEAAIHEAENGEADPIRYVIWLTDGMNTSGQQIWTPEVGTNYWRRAEEQCNDTGCRTVYIYEDGKLFDETGNRQNDFEFDFEFDDLEEFVGNQVNNDVANQLTELIEQGFEGALERSENAFEEALARRYETQPPDSEHDWEEGRLNFSVDYDTIEKCQAMKAEGIEIFAIGFALKAGTYYTNDWGDIYNIPTHMLGRHIKNNAVRLMLECASSNDHVMLPSNAEQLSAVFDKIGNKLAEESIRISN